MTDDRLMQHRELRLLRENVRHLGCADCLARLVDLRCGHCALAFRFARTAGRTNTIPELAPGIAPLTNSKLRSLSVWTTSRFSVVMRSTPRWPGRWLPLTVFAALVSPLLAGWRWIIEPWLAPPPTAFQRFMMPAKPLPLLMPVTSTRSPAANDSTVTRSPLFASRSE